MKENLLILYFVSVVSIVVLGTIYSNKEYKKPTFITHEIILADTNNNWMHIIVSNGVVLQSFILVPAISNIQILSVEMKTNK